MTANYRVLNVERIDERFAFAEDVLVGLSERPKRLSSKYFYDDKGSELFQKIMALDAYYPTRVEREIFEREGEGILRRVVDRPLNLIDLGAGDGTKTYVLIDHLRKHGADVKYVPIDISEAAIKGVVDATAKRYEGLEVEGLVSDYFDGLRWLSSQNERTNLVLFLGSNIGNFDRPRGRAFLRRLWNALNPGDYALVGFDLKKDIELLLKAYNDPDGVTAQFNMNLLERINRELGADFDLRGFRHFATYNVFSGAMESYLVSLAKQEVRIDYVGDTFEFKPWEPIHTEYSYKYLDEDIDQLSTHSGFRLAERFYDSSRWFCDALLRVVRS